MTGTYLIHILHIMMAAVKITVSIRPITIH